MRRLEPIVRAALAGDCRLPEGSTVLVAISGGADSVALLIALQRVAPEFLLQITAAHLDHGLRAGESRADRAFVEALCSRLGVPLRAARWNTAIRMRSRGLKGENGLRILRREFLEGAALRARAAAIATGHTADDQLETVLLRMLRGTGMAGLAGMRPRTGLWLKLLLEATRREIEADLAKVGQAWREDASNRDPAYTRNRVRHVAVPALVRAMAPALEAGRAHALLVRRVSRIAAEARAAQGALDRAASRWLKVHSHLEADGITLSVRALRRRAPAIARAVFRRGWGRLASVDTGLTHRHLESLERLAGAIRPNATVRLPSGFLAWREGDLLRVGTHRSASNEGTFQLRVPGEVSYPRRTIQGDWISGADALGRLIRKSGSEEYFAAEGLEGALELRASRADDSFVPFGGRRQVRIGEFLKKQRVSLEFQSRPTVLADAGGILWVVGVRRSARAPVTFDTRKALRVFAENHD